MVWCVFMFLQGGRWRRLHGGFRPTRNTQGEETAPKGDQDVGEDARMGGHKPWKSKGVAGVG